ncbi:hypothetical protein WJX81_005104 [Elliptochloris bilobata]|uniref:Rhodanese domain-containing protein n=1 Tax=Elliptochloris bilobata TaxID=381761 RepID=A0AAW1S870_9CHLO
MREPGHQYSQLQELGVKLISAQELLFAQADGVPVIDIRPPPEFDAGHIEGSVNVPLYRLITGWDTRKFLRRAGFAFFGVLNGTEVNPDFHSEVAAAADQAKGAVLICNMGGTMDDSKTKQGGMQSRSLMAAYELTNLGFKTGLRVLKGGFYEWRKSGRRVVTREEVVEEGDEVEE